MNRYGPFLLAGALILLLSMNMEASGDQGAYLKGGAYLDHGDPYIGVGYTFPIDDRLTFTPNADYVFVDNGDLYSFNLDGKYEVNPSAANPMWVGAGIGLIERDVGLVDNTDAALNVKWGMDFNNASERMTPFVSTKAAFSDNSEFAVSVGVRFGTSSRTQ